MYLLQLELALQTTMECIDLATLMPDQQFAEEQGMIINKCEDGLLSWVPKCPAKQITSWPIWQVGFSTYSAILLKYHPHLAVSLKQYEHTIQDAGFKHAWYKVYNYDCKFRHLMEQNS